MEELINEQFPHLPEPLQDLLQSQVLFELIEEILNEHPLQDVQKDAYAREVILVLIRVQGVDMFTQNIKHRMEIAMKRAEAISKKTKQLIFLSVDEYLIQNSSNPTDSETNKASDGVVPKAPTPVPHKKQGRIDHEIPLVEIGKKQEVPKSDHPIIAEAPEEVVPTPKAAARVLQKPSVPEGESNDIFKQRLQEPVYSPVEKNELGDGQERVANTSPSTKEDIEKDPYKESIE